MSQHALTSGSTTTFQPSMQFFDDTAFTLQPVQHYTSPPLVLTDNILTTPTYLINTNISSSDVYYIWRAQNTRRGSPALVGPVTVKGSYTYSVPPQAPQALGTGVELETGDTRITQAAGIRNEILAAHSTNCNVQGVNQSCIRYIRISVGTDTGPFGGGLVASLGQENTLSGGVGVFDFEPGIAVNAFGNPALAFHRSSANSFLSSFWRTSAIGPVTTSFGSDQIVASDSVSTSFGVSQAIAVGNCPQPLSRTGDFIGIQTDPFDFVSFWVTGERALSIGVGDFPCEWQTQIRKAG
jgi:hypothetical protein